MGLLIGMFIGETLRINPVIEEGAGKLTEALQRNYDPGTKDRTRG